VFTVFSVKFLVGWN